MNEQTNRIHMLFRQFCEMPVMSEKDNLGPAGQFCEYLQGGSRPFIIELDQNIVNDKGYGFVFLQISFKACQPDARYS